MSSNIFAEKSFLFIKVLNLQIKMNSLIIYAIIITIENMGGESCRKLTKLKQIIQKL